MANSEQTKRALAEGLKTALCSREFDQITVADITECSEVSRNTFYYHFRDKQELVDWIFHTDLGPVLRDVRPGRTWDEALLELFARLQRSRTFYAGILRNQSCHANHVGIAVLAVGDPVRAGRPVSADCRQLCQRLLRRRPRHGRRARGGVVRIADIVRVARHPAHSGRPLGPVRRRCGNPHPCTRASGRLRRAAEAGTGGGRHRGGPRLPVRTGGHPHHRPLVAARGRRVLSAGRLVLHRRPAPIRLRGTGRAVRVRVLRSGGGAGDPVRAVRNRHHDGGGGRGAGRYAVLRVADGQQSARCRCGPCALQTYVGGAAGGAARAYPGGGGVRRRVRSRGGVRVVAARAVRIESGGIAVLVADEYTLEKML